MSLAPIQIRIALTSIFIISILFNTLLAQRTIEGTPISSDKKYQPLFPDDIATEIIPSLDLEKIKREDNSTPGTNRFAAPSNVSFSLENNGSWTDLPDGGRVWQLKIHAKNALGLAVLYKNFFLPNGSRLYMYNENKTKVLGAYTSMNNLPYQKFMTGSLEGETAIIEYYEPWYSRGKGSFEIYQIMQSYHPERMQSDYEFQVYGGYGESLPCHQEINCSLGTNWQDEKRGIVRIRTVYTSGLGWCSGSLINNTQNDGTPYVLSANHCGHPGGLTPDYSMWRFDFNYEHPLCTGNSTEPSFESIFGSQLISLREESDFLLLQMYNYLPTSYNAYFNGWNNEPVAPQQGTMLHHPNGDVKKITIDNHALTIHSTELEWNNGVTTPPNFHFRSILDLGTLEGGSSGCPLFDPNGRIVGQLHGGNSSCTSFISYFGRFSQSWNAGSTPASRLMDWLDPTGSGVTTLDGINAPAPPVLANVSGIVMKENGVGVDEVQLEVTGDIFSSNQNFSNGTYAFNLPISGDYQVTPKKDDSHVNGVTTFDMVLIQQSILGTNTLSPYKMLAADVNDSGSVTTFDMVLIKRLILEIDTEFAAVPAWKFIPADFEFLDPSNPFPDPNNPATAIPSMLFYSPLFADLSNQDYIAIKMGDVNDTAN